MKYLITGATGDVGSKVVDLLIQRGNRPAGLRPRCKQGAVTLRRSRRNLSRRSRQRGSLEGSTSKESTSSSSSTAAPRFPARDELAAKASPRPQALSHLVKLSSMDVEQGLAIGAWHERGEAAIRTSGIPFTFVQPTGFMSNLLAWANSIKNEGLVRSSTGDGKRAFIHSDDIAAVATEALTTRNYIGQSLLITGPEALSFAEVTATIATAIGKQLTFQPIPDEEARQRYSVISASTEETEAHVSLWRAIREGRLAAVTDTVEHILGRKPIKLNQWLTENAAAFQ